MWLIPQYQAKEMRTHPHLFRSRAAEWTRTYANPDGRIVTEGPAPGGPSGNSAWSAGPSGAAATMDLAGTTHQLLSEEREHGHSSATTMQGGAIKDESLGYNASVEQSSIEQPLVQACTMCDASADRHIKEVSERMRRSRGAPSDGSALRAEQTNVQTCQATTSGKRHGRLRRISRRRFLNFCFTVQARRRHSQNITVP